MLDEILDPVARAFSRDVAEALIKIRPGGAAEKRIAELAEKCNEGQLTRSERAEYESYVKTIDLVSVLQAKARAWLAQQGAS